MQWPAELLCSMPYSVNSGFCNPRTTQKRGESFGISRIGNKIKGVFKSSAMEGAMLPNYNLNDGEDDFVSKSFTFFFRPCVVLFFFFFPHLLENVKLVFFCCLTSLHSLINLIRSQELSLSFSVVIHKPRLYPQLPYI